MHHPRTALCEPVAHGRDLQPVGCLSNFCEGGGGEVEGPSNRQISV